MSQSKASNKLLQEKFQQKVQEHENLIEEVSNIRTVGIKKLNEKGNYVWPHKIIKSIFEMLVVGTRLAAMLKT